MVVLGYYKSLAPHGCLVAASPVARSERDAMLLAWAMSNCVHEIAVGVLDRHAGMAQTKTLETVIEFGQIAGSIEARETLMQQHLSSDPSLFVVSKLAPSKESLMRRQLVAWTLKLAHDEIYRSIQDGQTERTKVMEERLALQKAAIGAPSIKRALSGKFGRVRPGDAAIRNACRNRTGLHPKAGDALRIYEGLRRLTPFALRRILCDSLLDRMGDQRLLELASGLALAEAFSIASGYPIAWNGGIETDGVMARVGPMAIGWHRPIDLDVEEEQAIVAAIDSRDGSCVSFVRCVDTVSVEIENAAIRIGTESIVAECRKEAKKWPRFEETPLSECALVMRRFLGFEPPPASPDRMVIANFDGIYHGRLLDLAKRVCRRANLN